MRKRTKLEVSCSLTSNDTTKLKWHKNRYTDRWPLNREPQDKLTLMVSSSVTEQAICDTNGERTVSLVSSFFCRLRYKSHWNNNVINNDFSQIILRQAQSGCTLHKPRGPFTWTLTWMMSLGVTQCRMALHSGQIRHDASQHSSLLGKSNIAGLLNLLTTPYDLGQTTLTLLLLSSKMWMSVLPLRVVRLKEFTAQCWWK